MTGVEVNQRAVLLANENAERLGLADRFRACAPEEAPADATYDEIWSNPPIRIGKQALHDLLLHWFARLGPDGRAVMVVGKNLGGDSLQAWLTDQGYPTDAAGQRQGVPGARVAARGRHLRVTHRPPVVELAETGVWLQVSRCHRRPVHSQGIRTSMRCRSLDT